MDLAQTMLSAAAPMLLQQSQHEQAVEHSSALMEKQLEEAAKLHRQAIRNAKQHHSEAIKKGELLGYELLEQELRLSRRLHREAIDQQNAFFRDNRDLSIGHFESARKLSEELHSQQLGFALRTHTHQIQVAHESARRENVRDVWIQKGRKVDTMLITTTLMFAACVAVLCEGNLPHPSVEDFDGGWPPKWIVITWSVFASTSFVSLLACIFLILVTQARMAEYNIYEINQRYMCFRHGPTCRCNTCGEADTAAKSGSENGPHKSRWRLFRESWTRVPDTHRTFEDYYACHCAGLANLATTLFNIGTVTLVIHAAMTLSARLYYIQESDVAAYVYIGIFFVFLIIIEVFHLSIHTKTRMAHEEASNNNADDFYERERRIYEPLATVHTTKVPKPGKPVLIAKIETAGEGKPFLFVTFEDRTLTETDDDYLEDCKISFREVNELMSAARPRGVRLGSATRRTKPGTADHSSVPIHRERMHLDPLDNSQKAFKVWYKIHRCSRRGVVGGLNASHHAAETLQVPPFGTHVGNKRSTLRQRNRPKEGRVTKAEKDTRFYIDLSKPLLKPPHRRNAEWIELDEDEQTKDAPWRWESPHKGWAIVRIKYSEKLLNERTRLYQMTALKLAKIDAYGADTRSLASGTRTPSMGVHPSGPATAAAAAAAAPSEAATPVPTNRSDSGQYYMDEVLDSDDDNEDSDDGEDAEDVLRPEIFQRARAAMPLSSGRRRGSWLRPDTEVLQNPLLISGFDASDADEMTELTADSESNVFGDDVSDPPTPHRIPRIAQISV